ncbi:hypothetical protein J5X84_31480 [Streptosporangiaceae bacterium NEAU-GS5]|nr:hypothetical protein [Streptosporangiaceae bacterium NEAU-GS5]
MTPPPDETGPGFPPSPDEAGPLGVPPSSDEAGPLGVPPPPGGAEPGGVTPPPTSRRAGGVTPPRAEAGPLGTLRARLDEFAVTGDPALVSGADVLADLEAAEELADANTDADAADANVADVNAADAAYVTGWIRWYRSLTAADKHGREEERDAALTRFERVYMADPESVPGPLQAELSARGLREPVGEVVFDVRAAVERYQRHLTTGDLKDLDEAIAGLRRARARLSRGHMLAPLTQVILGLALLARYLRTSRSEVLRESVTVLRTGVRRLPPRHEMRGMALAALANVLYARYVETNEPALLAEMRQALAEASTAAESGGPLDNLVAGGVGLLTSMVPPLSETRPGSVLDQEVDLARRALTTMPAGAAGRPAALTHLAVSLLRRFAANGAMEDLEEALPPLREADATVPADHAARSQVSALLGVVLCELARRPAPSHDAEDGAEQGTAAGPEERTLYGEEGAEEGVALLIAARHTLPIDDETAPLALLIRANLATALWHRYKSTPIPGDAAPYGPAPTSSAAADSASVWLDDAIATTRATLVDLPGSAPLGPYLKAALATGLLERYRRSADASVLDEALEAGRVALRGAAEGTSEHLAALAVLRDGLLAKGGAAEAVSWGRRQLRSAPAGHAGHARSVVGLAWALLEQDALGHDVLDGVDEVIDLLRDLRTDAAHHVRGTEPFATALLTRFRTNGEIRDLNEAIEVTRDVASVACRRLLGTAFHARWQRTRDRTDLTRARDALDSGLRLIASSAGRRTTGPLSGRRPVGGEGERLAANVLRGTVIARQGNWAVALESFEAAVAALPQVPLREIRRLSGPYPLYGLAGDAAACALNADEPERAVELLEHTRGVFAAHELAQRSAAAGAGADGGAGIGAGGGGRLTGAQIQGAAAEGPIVYLNVSDFRCDALIVTTGGVEAINLLATRAEFVGRAARLLTNLDDTLGWLWDKVTGPVLDRMAASRVWWCPTGPLAALPVHAAQGQGESALERVVSSYTVTVGALLRGRSQVPGDAPLLRDQKAVYGPSGGGDQSGRRGLDDQVLSAAFAAQLGGTREVVATLWDRDEGRGVGEGRGTGEGRGMDERRDTEKGRDVGAGRDGGDVSLSTTDVRPSSLAAEVNALARGGRDADPSRADRWAAYIHVGA